MVDGPKIPPFVMHGARGAIASGLLHIEEQVKGIERAVEENPGLAFDLAKTLIESACRTILTERSITFNPDEDLPRLFRIVTSHLPFLPASASRETKVRRSLSQTINGLHTAVQGVCELRNACGFASHGVEGPRPAMEAVQALLAAETADAILGFLYRVHRQDRMPAPSQQLEYDDNPGFNDYVDEAHGTLRILEVEFKPSEVLFRMDPEAYRVYLAEYELEPRGDVVATDETKSTEEEP